MAELTSKQKQFLWEMLIDKCYKFMDQYNAEGKGFRREMHVWTDAIYLDDDIREFYLIIKKIGAVPENNAFDL